MTQYSPVPRYGGRGQNAARMRRAAGAFQLQGAATDQGVPAPIYMGNTTKAVYRLVINPSPTQTDTVKAFSVSLQSDNTPPWPAPNSSYVEVITLKVVGQNTAAFPNHPKAYPAFELESTVGDTIFSVTGRGECYMPRTTVTGPKTANEAIDQNEYGRWLSCNTAGGAFNFQVTTNFGDPSVGYSVVGPGAWIGFFDFAGDCHVNSVTINASAATINNTNASQTLLDTKYGGALIIADHAGPLTSPNFIKLMIPGAKDPAVHGVVTEINSNYSVTYGDRFILGDTSNGDIVLTLPPASHYKNKQLTVKHANTDSNTITIDGNGAETIDGQNTHKIGGQESAILFSDGSAWWLEGSASVGQIISVACTAGSNTKYYYDMVGTEGYIISNTSNTNTCLQINLTSAASFTGKQFVTKLSNSLGGLKFQAPTGEKIHNNSNVTFFGNYYSIIIWSDGATWHLGPRFSGPINHFTP